MVSTLGNCSEISANSVIIAYMPNINFVPSIIAYAAGIRTNYAFTEVVICSEIDGGSRDYGSVNFSEDGLIVKCGKPICDELEARGCASATGDRLSLLLWNHEASFHWNLLSNDSAKRLAAILSNFSMHINIYFMCDGWVGTVWDCSRIIHWSESIGISPSTISQLSFRGLPDERKFNEAGIAAIVVGEHASATALRLCGELSKREFAASLAQLSSALGASPLLIVMRPWFNHSFHGGMYDFGSVDPIFNASTLIAFICNTICNEVNLHAPSTVLLCPDHRSEKHLPASKLHKSLQSDLDIPVLNLHKHFPPGADDTYFITLDYILPALISDHRITLYSFDSNTTVPLHMAELPFTSIHGAPSALLDAFGATPKSVNYISGNVRRIISYASPMKYTSRDHPSGVVIISPGQQQS